MHESVMEWCTSELKPDLVASKDVLEVGSRIVNGSIRWQVESMGPLTYTGIDPWDGRGVDLVLDAKHLVQTFGIGRFDVVISTEMLEHAEEWQIAVNQMKLVLRPGGWLFITTRGPGFEIHGYPDDFHRFDVETLNAALSDMENVEVVPDPQHPGVFAKAIRPAQMPDTDPVFDVRALPLPVE